MNIKTNTSLENNAPRNPAKNATPPSVTAVPSEQSLQLPDWPPEPEIIPLEKLDPDIRDAFYSLSKNAGAPTPGAEPLAGNQRLLSVFDYAELMEASLRAEDADRKVKGPIDDVLNNALKNGGMREVPQLDGKVLTQRLLELAAQMPNFSPVIDCLLAESGFLLTGHPLDFYIPPMLLVGEPGLGKTRFVIKLCAVFDVPFEKFSIGSLQTSADLTGSSRTWSNTHPGRITELMARSASTSPFVLLDEIDKAASSDQFPLLGTLLDLLEPDSAKTIRDECLGIRFDASRVIYVATANDLSAIDPSLRSRFRILEIKAPDAKQRRVIIENVFNDLIGKRDFEIEQEVIDWLADLDVDLRELQRQLRESVGRALLNNERCLRMNHLRIRIEPKRRGIGFLSID